MRGADAPRAGGREPLTVDAFSVVKVRVKAVSDARSRNTLGGDREGTGIVIDSSGLILTIGYLVQEADSVEVSAADGRGVPASVIAYDFSTGFGLLRAAKPPTVKPIAFGDSATVPEREPVLIVGFDGVAPAFVVSRRPFAGYWEYLLDEAIYTAPATVNWQGAALINKEGKLLGVGSLVVGDAIGKGQVPGNLFVPIDLLKPILGDLISQGRTSSKPRPWIGVNTQDLQGKLIVTRVRPTARPIRRGSRAAISSSVFAASRSKGTPIFIASCGRAAMRGPTSCSTCSRAPRSKSSRSTRWIARNTCARDPPTERTSARRNPGQPGFFCPC